MAADISIETLRERDPKKLIPPCTALIKNEQDVHLFERLAFVARRDGRSSGLRMALRELTGGPLSVESALMLTLSFVDPGPRRLFSSLLRALT
jgi:hypothetical protein